MTKIKYHIDLDNFPEIKVSEENMLLFYFLSTFRETQDILKILNILEKVKGGDFVHEPTDMYDYSTTASGMIILENDVEFINPDDENDKINLSIDEFKKITEDWAVSLNNYKIKHKDNYHIDIQKRIEKGNELLEEYLQKNRRKEE